VVVVVVMVMVVVLVITLRCGPCSLLYQGPQNTTYRSTILKRGMRATTRDDDYDDISFVLVIMMNK